MIFKKDYGRQEDFVHGLMNGMVSRFSLSSPAPFKGDFFLTSRFEQLDGQESFESWIKFFGWRKVWLDLKKFKQGSGRQGSCSSEIFSDLHLKSW